MKKYLTGVLILSSIVLLFESCSSLRRQGYQKVPLTGYPFTPVFAPSFEKVLYSAEINFGKKTFSSLAVIKQVPEHNSFRLAFLSETGMRLFEMEFFHDGSTRVHYMTDFLNKKALVKKLLADFKLLFPLASEENIIEVFSLQGDSTTYINRLNENGKKDYYFISDNEGPAKIKERGCAYGKTSVFLDQYKNGFPGEIRFTHRMLKFSINLKQINYPGWN